MFISKDQIAAEMGVSVSQDDVKAAQLMIEVWVGRDEAEIEDGADLAVLARATMFQALYLSGNGLDIALVQTAVKRQTEGPQTIEFNTAVFAPFMSPWAVKACERLSWVGTRTVHTGPMHDRANVYDDFHYRWERA